MEKYRTADIVSDKYHPNSLEATARECRCKGTRRHVGFDNAISRNCEQVLWLNENKMALFSFLAEQVVTNETDKDVHVVSTRVGGYTAHRWTSLDYHLATMRKYTQG